LPTISRLHAIAQIVAKGSSVAIFAFGTALFASATLLSISVALSVLCLLLACGVLGRVIAMWIVAKISRENRPVLHKLVKSEQEAGEYFHAIAELDLQLEIQGHVIIDGRCIRSRSPWLAAPTYFGLLAKPFDAIAVAEKGTMRATTGVLPPYPTKEFTTPATPVDGGTLDRTKTFDTLDNRAASA
jgi:hypothetical protein